MKVYIETGYSDTSFDIVIDDDKGQELGRVYKNLPTAWVYYIPLGDVLQSSFSAGIDPEVKWNVISKATLDMKGIGDPYNKKRDAIREESLRQMEELNDGL
jgi:hypothetical protein